MWCLKGKNHLTHIIKARHAVTPDQTQSNDNEIFPWAHTFSLIHTQIVPKRIQIFAFPPKYYNFPLTICCWIFFSDDG